MTNLGFELLRKTRRKPILMMDVIGISPEDWNKVYDNGRMTILYDFNITGRDRKIMVGELRIKNMTHQEFLSLR